MKFFKQAFKEGSPISTHGFADALMSMDKAWETLSVFGGRVDWSQDGRPKIIMDAASTVARAPQLFEVIHEYADHLVCAFVSKVDESTGDPIPNDIPEEDPPVEEETAKVMKPWLLRSKPFNGRTRGGIAYSSRDQSTRDAEDAETETQTITPGYLKRESGATGEMIYGIWFEGDGWVDINTAGRCWAVNEDYEESLESVPSESSIPNASTVPK
jgi:hypothetical protein